MAIQQDYAKTGKCLLTITAKVSELTIYGWSLAKGSPHLENFNRGYKQILNNFAILSDEITFVHSRRTLSAIETGLIEKWQRSFQPDARPCYEEKQTVNSRMRRRTKKTLDRLTLDNLAGAFALLGLGSVVSIVSFVLETIHSRFAIKLKRNNIEMEDETK